MLFAGSLLGQAAAPSDAVPFQLLQGLGDTRYHLLESSAGEQTYHLYVRLPEGYEQAPAVEFPTVYLLDGGVTYPLLSGYYRYLVLGEEIPEAIIVGIAYGTADWQAGNNRGHDYTAPAPDRDHYGGAAAFQELLRTEVLPLIERNYRADPTRRILFGQSLGGQFVLFTALTEPELFWGHIASNPALHRNLPFFLPGASPPHETTGSRLFVASGSHDDPVFRVPALEWIRAWSETDSRPWRLETRTLEGHGHFSAVPAAFRQGMRWLFGDADDD